MSDTNQEEEFNQDVFDSMLTGSFEAEEESVEEEAGTADDSEDNDDEYQEDTDQDDDSEDEEELDRDDDGDQGDDSDDEDEDEGEDSLVEDDDLDEDSDADEEIINDDEDADDAEDDSNDDSDEDTEDTSEDTTDTEEDSDGDDSETTDSVDYKAFYDSVVNAEFVVNGKKVKGFSDPAKIIQSQQMAGGFSEKMAGFKQYRPFMAPLKERGMLEDQAKFDLAMNLVDGDKEAIKAHLKSLEIDPLDLDMEDISYSGKSTVATEASLNIEDTMERAKASGIEDRVRDIIGKQWDAESFQEFTSNAAVRDDLLNHIESGAYDAVQNKIAELSRLDYSGQFASMNTISKYRAAVGELQKEQPAPVVEAVEATPVKKAKKPTVQSEKAKILKARKEAEYKVKAEKNKAKITKQRSKAASVSKKKAKAKPKVKFDPMTVEGEELDNLMDMLITGGR